MSRNGAMSSPRCGWNVAAAASWLSIDASCCHQTEQCSDECDSTFHMHVLLVVLDAKVLFCNQHT